MVFSGRPTSVGTTQPGGSQGPSSLDLAMSEWAKPKGAGGSAKGARHSSLAVAEWRTLLTEFFARKFASPWSGQQAERFVSAKNQERKAANLKRKQGDQLTLITIFWRRTSHTI